MKICINDLGMRSMPWKFSTDAIKQKSRLCLFINRELNAFQVV